MGVVYRTAGEHLRTILVASATEPGMLATVVVNALVAHAVGVLDAVAGYNVLQTSTAVAVKTRGAERIFFRPIRVTVIVTVEHIHVAGIAIRAVHRGAIATFHAGITAYIIEAVSALALESLRACVSIGAKI